MALSIKDEETDRLARDLAAKTGESLTVAVRSALSERLERVQREGRARGTRLETLQEIVERCAALPERDSRTAEEILGYDEDGLPT